MQVFRKTEHGRQVVNANNRKAYYKRKAKLLEEKENEKIEINV